MNKIKFDVYQQNYLIQGGQICPTLEVQKDPRNSFKSIRYNPLLTTSQPRVSLNCKV